jgi:NAD(P)-dependent dehydrogenase (short-subunit alcohol dehydrogenase family)
MKKTSSIGKTVSASGALWGILTTLAGGALLLSAILREKRRIDFQGASVVITGGSRGLGLEMARILARQGARLTLLARDLNELERARRELIALGGYILIRQCDIGNPGEIQRAVELIIEKRGRIDVLINNAGVIQVGPFENMEQADFEEALDVYVRGPLALIKAVVPSMKRQGAGRIVNISSIAGTVAIPHMAPYSTGKHALTGLSDTLRSELAGDNILVTTVAPGLMRTGSHVNAHVKGNHRREFTWFALSAGSPLLSVNAERAAMQILTACRYGDPSLVIGLPARILQLMNVLLPRATASAMKLAGRILPSPTGTAGNQLKTGWESRSSVAPSLLTRAADKAISRNNEGGIAA